MATLQINLPDEFQQRIATRAAEGGYKSVDEYVEAFMWAISTKAHMTLSLNKSCWSG